MFDEKPKNQNLVDPLSVVLQWPRICGVDGCGDETDVTFLQVRDKDDTVLTGPASQFCTKPYVLRPDYMFVRWITRCGEHYSQDVERANKDQLRGVEKNNHNYMLNKPHEERMIVLRNLMGKCVIKAKPPEPQDYEEAS